MTNSDNALGIIMIGLGVASFIYLNSRGIHVNSKMKFKGGKWRLESTTIYENSKTLSSEILNEENKRRQSLIQYNKSKEELSFAIGETMNKDLKNAISAKSHSNKYLLEIFKNEYAQEALEMIIKDYRKQSKVYTAYDFEMYSDNQLNNPASIPKYFLSGDLLLKLFPMWNK